MVAEFTTIVCDFTTIVCGLLLWKTSVQISSFIETEWEAPDCNHFSSVEENITDFCKGLLGKEALQLNAFTYFLIIIFHLEYCGLYLTL